MGADIHLVVEASATPEFLSPRGVAFFEWPRDSQLFRAMGLHGKPCLIPVRGFPEPASSMAYGQYGLHVIPDGDLEAALAMPSITETEALQALQDGQSQFLSYTKSFVSNPAYSNASWLSLSEFSEALRFADVDRSALSLECLLTVKLLESIEAYEQCARMVFWFDL